MSLAFRIHWTSLQRATSMGCARSLTFKIKGRIFQLKVSLSRSAVSQAFSNDWQRPGRALHQPATTRRPRPIATIRSTGPTPATRMPIPCSTPPWRPCVAGPATRPETPPTWPASSEPWRMTSSGIARGSSSPPARTARRPRPKLIASKMPSPPGADFATAPARATWASCSAAG